MVAVAHDRMERLMTMARDTSDPTRSRRYVTLARRIGMRYNVKMPPGMRSAYCRGCNTYLRAGANCRVRLGRHRLTRTCLTCGNVRRTAYGSAGSRPPIGSGNGGYGDSVALVDEETGLPEEEGEEE